MARPPHRSQDLQRHTGPAREEGAGEAAAVGPAGMRIDKWLWCARFFRTRSVAQAAVEAGHVQLNGERVKPGRQVRIGDRLHVARAQERFEVEVLGLPPRRGPAPEARRSFHETPESEAARARQRELQRLSAPVSGGRPDKRQRRDLVRFTRRREILSDDGDVT